MAFTTEQLEALETAYASGSLRVRFKDREEEFGNASDLLSRIRTVRAEIAAAAGTTAPRQIRVVTDSGY